MEGWTVRKVEMYGRRNSKVNLFFYLSLLELVLGENNRWLRSFNLDIPIKQPSVSCITYESIKHIPLSQDYSTQDLSWLILARVSNPWPMDYMHPRMARNVAQHKIINLLKISFFCSSVFISVCVLCGPRQLFFQCGPEMPKGWTPPDRKES